MLILLTPIYLLWALIIIYHVTKRIKGKKKWLVFLLLAFLFYLPIGWDVILGRAYFKYLCHTDGGTHIYETVELGPEYWYDDGNPKFYTEKDRFDESIFNGRYQYVGFRDPNFHTIFNIRRDVRQIIDKSRYNTVLGERVGYQYWGGWVINTWQPFQSGSTHCKYYLDELEDNPDAVGKKPKIFRKFTSYIFLRKNINTESVR